MTLGPPDAPARTAPEESRADLPLAILGISLGAIGLVPLVAIVAGPHIDPNNPIGSFQSQRTLFNVYFGATVVFLALATVFLGFLNRRLSVHHSAAALGAALVGTAGTITGVLAVTLSIEMLNVIVDNSNAPSYSAAVYQASIWVALGSTLGVAASFLLGLGIFLFGWLAWRGGRVPDWLALTFTVGGASGFLAWFSGWFEAVLLTALIVGGFGLGILAVLASMRPSEFPASGAEAAGPGGLAAGPDAAALRERARSVLEQLRSRSTLDPSAERAVSHLEQALKMLREGRVVEAEGHMRLAESYARLG